MSYVDISEAKEYLRISHSADDDMVQRLIDSAEYEACDFMNVEELPTLPGAISGNALNPAVFQAIMLLVEAGYDRMEPEEYRVRRARAEDLLMPHRENLGA